MFCRIAVWLCAAFTLIALAGMASAQDDIAAQTLSRINQARADAGLPPLTRNAQLDAAAQAHADDLQKNGVSLGHRGSDGSNIRQRIARAGYNGAATGENWAAYRTLEQIMNFWLTDPPHRRNILHVKFREIGIGVAQRANGGLIVITDFGAPGNAPEIANAAVAPSQNAPQKPRAAPTQAQAAAPKPTRAPTRAPTRKPTRARKQPTAVPTPLPEPTQVAIARVPQTQSQASEPLRARGRVAKTILRADASLNAGMVYAAGDPFRMTLGAVLAVSGALVLGLAVAGHWQSRNR